MLMIDMGPLGLLVGTIRAVDLRALVPLQSSPLEVFAESLFSVQDKSFLLMLVKYTKSQEESILDLCLLFSEEIVHSSFSPTGS